MQATVSRLAIHDQTTCPQDVGMDLTAATVAPTTMRTPPTAPVDSVGLVDLGPIAQLRAGRLARRLPQLALGLVLYGLSLTLMVRGDLGLAPWDVLHSGLASHLPLDLGGTIVLVSFVVLLAWIPLRERPGIGTVANAVVIGLTASVALQVLDRPDVMALRIAYMLGGIALCAVATACYIGAQLGRGPRDGLMTGLHRRTGMSLRLVRTGLELGVVVVGLALGGHLGVGTLLFALGIGPLTQALLPLFVIDLPKAVATP